MIVELKDNAGWKRHSSNASSIEEAAYEAVRKTHGFLTDSNHTFSAGEKVIQWGGKDITYSSVIIYRGDGAPEYQGPEWAKTDYWFTVKYRAHVEDKAKEPTP